MTRKFNLDKFFEEFGKNGPRDKKLPKGSTTTCLECGTPFFSGKRKYGLCGKCLDLLGDGEINTYKELFQLIQLKNYPSKEFEEYLANEDLNTEIIEAYFENLLPKSERYFAGYLLSAKQGSMRLQIRMNDAPETFAEDLLKLVLLRKTAEYDGQIARVEASRYLAEKEDIEVETLWRSIATLKSFDLILAINQRNFLKDLGKALWNGHSKSAEELIEIARDAILLEESIKEAEKQFRSKSGHSLRKVLQGIEAERTLKGLGVELELTETPSFREYILALESNDTFRIDQIEKCYKSMLETHLSFSLLMNSSISEELQQEAIEARELLMGFVKDREGFRYSSENPLVERLETVSNGLDITLSQLVCRFVWVVRRDVDPEADRQLEQWLFNLLVKEDLTVWTEILAQSADPTDEELTYSRYLRKVDKSKLNMSSDSGYSKIPEWGGYGARPQSSNPWRGPWH